MVRLQSDLEDRHANQIEQKNLDIGELTNMVEELAVTLRELQVSIVTEETLNPTQNSSPGVADLYHTSVYVSL